MPEPSDAALERAVEGHLVRQLALVINRGYYRCKVKKIGGPGWRGWPDRMVLYDGGCAHFIELKRPKGGKFEPLQLHTHDMLRKLGFAVFVLNTKAEVDKYVSDLIAFGPYDLP
jgi:hypothetical protein